MCVAEGACGAESVAALHKKKVRKRKEIRRAGSILSGHRIVWMLRPAFVCFLPNYVRTRNPARAGGVHWTLAGTRIRTWAFGKADRTCRKEEHP